jgi:hypothetical protein
MKEFKNYPEMKMRRCLRCLKDFKSLNPGNRICRACSGGTQERVKDMVPYKPSDNSHLKD